MALDGDLLLIVFRNYSSRFNRFGFIVRYVIRKNGGFMSAMVFFFIVRSGVFFMSAMVFIIKPFWFLGFLVDLGICVVVLYDA